MASARRGSTSAGRVIAGAARGTRLVGPGEGTRPLGDRVKQSLFAILEPTIRSGPFLDLYAGSGAAGIEALSRGATRAVFVERDRAATAAIRRNLAATGFADRSELVQGTVERWLGGASSPGATFAGIVLDPPYDEPRRIGDALEAIAAGGPAGLLEAVGIVVAKHAWKATVPYRIGLLTSFRQERFGETMLTFYRWEDAAG